MSRRIVCGGGRTGGGGGDGDGERGLWPLACEFGLVVDLEVGGRNDLAPAVAGSVGDGEEGSFDGASEVVAVRGSMPCLLSECWMSFEVGGEGESTVMGE